jgi:glutamine---fructose-6-phosphate transaminase (isomerizing)
MSPTSIMAEESRAAPLVVAHQLARDDEPYAALVRSLRERPPAALATVARGSSDHAAHYLAYLVMARLGIVVSSLPMSLVTLYGSALRCEQLLGVCLSQSGQSPDLVSLANHLRAGGAHTLALVNDVGSPLARAVQHLLPLHAGSELSVAATKSYIAQLVASARLVAQWEDRPDLRNALPRLPDDLRAALALDWSAALEPLQSTDRLFVVGRGPALAVAEECALKLKETCAIAAEAFSGAEVRHGPMALVGRGFTVLVIATRGPAQAGLVDLARELRQRGATVLLAGDAQVPDADLPLHATAHELLDPIAAAQSFYPMVEALARARGLDPDRPRHLAKVTRTH